MGFVLAPFLVVGAIAAVIWFFLFRATVRHERAVERAKQRNTDFEKQLRNPGEPLYCLSCEQAFPGPLPERGCPNCHLAAFVIPTATSDNQQIQAAGALVGSPAILENKQTSQNRVSRQTTEDPVQRSRNQGK